MANLDENVALLATRIGEEFASLKSSYVAKSAEKLENPVTIQTNLASTTAASFDGTANVTPGVTGVLPVANGGTGSTTAADALTALGAASASDLASLEERLAAIEARLAALEEQG